MRKMKNYSKIRLISSCLFLGFHLISYEQSLDEELKSRLTGNENKKIEKADEIFQKGVKLEEEADNILNMASSSSNNDKISIRKKYTSKRLEAALYYYTSNHDKIEVYQTAIKNFWKKFSGDKNSLKEIHAIEGMTDDSISYATDLRSNANQSANNFAKLDLILQAETIEKRVSPMLAKVLFSYLSYPVQYDPAWINSQTTAIPVRSANEATDTTQTNVNKAQPAKNETDTLKAISEIEPVKGLPRKSPDYTFQGQQQQLQTNDSSLYGKIAVSEEQVDVFNQF